MEKNVRITFKEALECYQSGNDTLVRLALRSFSKEALETEGISLCIKSSLTAIEDAARILCLNDTAISDVYSKLGEIDSTLQSQFKIDLVHKAFNKITNVQFTQSKDEMLFSPQFVYYKGDVNEKFSDLKIIGNFIYKGSKYTVAYVTIAPALDCDGSGCYNFSTEYGIVEPNFATLGFANKHLAEYFAETFWADVFNAYFGQYITII